MPRLDDYVSVAPRQFLRQALHPIDTYYVAMGLITHNMSVLRSRDCTSYSGYRAKQLQCEQAEV